MPYQSACIAFQPEPMFPRLTNLEIERHLNLSKPVQYIVGFDDIAITCGAAAGEMLSSEEDLVVGDEWTFALGSFDASVKQYSTDIDVRESKVSLVLMSKYSEKLNCDFVTRSFDEDSYLVVHGRLKFGRTYTLVKVYSQIRNPAYA